MLAMLDRSGHGVAVWIAWTALACLQVGAIVVFGVDVPLQDEWSTITHAARPELRWSELWAAGNGVHRLPLPRLVYVVLGTWTDWDYRAPMVFNAAGLALLSAVWIRAAAKVRGRASITDVSFPLLAMGGGMLYQVLFGFQLTFMCSTLPLGLLLAWLVWAERITSRRSSVVLAVAVVLLPLCGANAVIATVPLAVWMFARSVGALRGARVDGGDALDRAGATVQLVGVACCVAVVALYLVDVDLGHREGTRARSLESAAQSAGRFLSLAIGPAARWLWPGAALVVVSALGVLACFVCVRAVRAPRERWRALGVIALGTGWVGMGLAIGLGRGDGAAGSGFATRYLLLAAPLGAGLALVPTWLASDERASRPVRAFAFAAPIALLVTLVAATPRALAEGLRWSRDVSSARAGFSNELRRAAWLDYRLVQAQVLRDHVGDARRVHVKPKMVVERLPLLERRALGPFRHGAADEPLVDVLVLIDRGLRDGAPIVALDELAERGVTFEDVRHGKADARQLVRSEVFPTVVEWKVPSDTQVAYEDFTREDRAPFFVVVDLSARARHAALRLATHVLHGAHHDRKTLIVWCDPSATEGEHARMVAAWSGVIDSGVVDERPVQLRPMLEKIAARWTAATGAHAVGDPVRRVRAAESSTKRTR